jgi:NAD-dependent deacetylase
MAKARELDRRLTRAAEIILESEYVTSLTGAGVSVESKIRPFRGPGGLWTEKGEPSMNGYQKLLEDPEKYWRNRLNQLNQGKFSKSIFEAEPNPGHIALAELEKMGILRTLITQNIDGLHAVAGSKKILRIHGTVHKLRCIECETRYDLDDYDYSDIPPICSLCGGLVKSDTVMFGEPIPSGVLQECFREADKSDLMLVAGTSAYVYPAAGLPVTVKRNGGRLIEVNLRATKITELSEVCIRQPFGEALPALVKKIKELK